MDCFLVMNGRNSDEEFADLLRVIENFKTTFEHHDVLQRQVLSGENQIVQLQKALGDLQACLTQEREHCLKLSVENQVLKRELVKANISSRTEQVRYVLPFVSSSIKPDDYVQWKHVEKQLKLAQDQAANAIEESQVVKKEIESLQARTSSKINSLLDRLQSAQQLLYETMKDYVELKKSVISEKSSPKDITTNSSSEKDGTKSKLQPKCYVRPNNGSVSINTHHHIVDKIAVLQKQIEDIKKKSMTVSDQNFFRELQSEQETLKNMLNQLKTVKPLCQKLERKHKNDIEGLRNDMRDMKSQLKSLERLLTKTVRQMTEDEKDAKYLDAVQASSAQVKQVSDELRRLKLKLAQLEFSLTKV